ncbi:MAG: WYL domain-containing transcriptional regulator [Chlorobium phaeobacteroides]|uniref:Helix-turn-helix type 11 domain protein n=1 Tax=Chlorobium phaeobacteroides (strain BS1) TaxID=331678 RepID=B3EN70_CHLPB|nr:WYL domain-containing transcriptional regulator [Chlorobium phaeobacteroides]MBL6957310.1 WYL domain-containing transcriptional regulator [Chlorobium phaeobacteroides]
MKQSRPPVVRMYFLDEQLRKKLYPNCTSLAAHFEVSRKTIQRDIDYMRDLLDAPIEYHSKKKGFFYRENWVFLPSAFLEQNEAEALKATKKVLSQYRGTPYYNEVSRALDKVLQYLPGSLGENDLFSIYSFDNLNETQEFSGHFATIEDAIRQKLKIGIVYDAPSSGKVTERTIHPYRLHYSHTSQTWYLVAHCELRKEIRTFVVGRIKKLRVQKGNFELPQDFSVDAYLSKTFDQVVGETEQVVSIRFSAYQAPWIREKQWHPTQRIEPLDDGGLTVHFRVSGLDAIKRWVMRYGKEAEVLEPAELRDMVRNEVRDMGVVYEE